MRCVGYIHCTSGWVSKLSLLPFALTPPPTIKRKNVKKKGLSGSKRIAEYRAGMEESCKLFSLQEENEGVHASLLDSMFVFCCIIYLYL